MMPTGRRILFFRHFEKFGGHHLKVWHYFNHALALGLEPYITFTPESVWDDSNPWAGMRDRVVDEPERLDPDMLFLSGMDWSWALASGVVRDEVPVFNLIQHVFHAWPSNARSAFLPHRAIRLCLSPEVQAAIEESGRARGPVFTIPSAIEFDRLHALAGGEREIDILIAALKAPELGARLAARLRRPGRVVELADRLIPREEFLGKMSRAHVTAFLPWEIEGFYIPAIEGMAVGTVVVCPDVIVNRSFCLPGVNCFRPEYNEDALVSATESALAQLADLGPMRERAVETAREHDLSFEREAFDAIVSRREELWALD
jgi:hypothetical protein